MPHPKQNPEFYRLDKTGRILNLSGVPLNFLKKKTDPQTFNFCQVTHKIGENVVMIYQENQRKNFTQFCSDLSCIGDGGLLAIGSSPTEQAAYECATYISRQFYDGQMSKAKVPTVKWIDLGSPDWSYLKSEEDDPELVVVHGIQEDSDSRRIEMARDFLRKSDSSTKILLSATSNILSFMTDRIRVMPDIVWQLGKRTHRVV